MEEKLNREALMNNPFRAWRTTLAEGLTIPEAAEMVDVTTEAWRQWEWGINIPNDFHLRKLASIMGYDDAVSLFRVIEKWRKKYIKEAA